MIETNLDFAVFSSAMLLAKFPSYSQDRLQRGFILKYLERRKDKMDIPTQDRIISKVYIEYWDDDEQLQLEDTFYIIYEGFHQVITMLNNIFGDSHWEIKSMNEITTGFILDANDYETETMNEKS